MGLNRWAKDARQGLAILCCGIGVCTTPLLAQVDASLVTPRDLRPETRLPGPALEHDASEDSGRPAVPEGASTLRVTLAEIVVEGGFDVLSEATHALIDPFRGRSSTVEELHTLADALEALYSNAGFVLARVTIPPQEVTDGGDFRLLVLDGYLEGINLEGVPEHFHSQLQAGLARLVGRRQLQRVDIERALILVGRTPGLAVRSTLVAGGDVGAATLVIEGQYTRYSGSVAADNRLSEALGPWQATLQLQVNQLLGRGEQIYAYVSGHPNPEVFFRGGNKRQVAGGGINWPLGHNGLSLNAEFTASDTRMPSGSTFIPGVRSRFDRVSLRLSKPVVLSRLREVSVTGQFDMSRQANTVPDFGVALYRDALRVFRVNVDARQSLQNGAQLSLFLQASQGLEQGARSIEDAESSGVPFSRLGAHPGFTKLEFTAVWNQLLPANVLLASTFRAQHVLKGPLPSAELFSFDGENALSALVSGRLADDAGWTWRNEFSKGFALQSLALQLSPYGYLTVGEPSTEVGDTLDSSLAAGVGLRTGWGPLSLSMEYGHSRMSPGSSSGNEFFAKVQMVF